MKKIIPTTFVLAVVVASSAFAQEKPIPAKEFTIELSSSVLEIKPGESREINITLNRSKGYSKSKAVLGLSSGLPQGVTITFEPAEGVLDSSTAKIAVAENAKPGRYTIILNSTIQYKSKGTALKLVVDDTGNTAVTSNN